MKFICLLVLSVFMGSSVNAQFVHPANNNAFLQNEVASVYVTMSAVDAQTMVTDSLYSDFPFITSVIYSSSAIQDTITNVGIHVRGNTSRDAAKKSFELSFNSYVQGRKYRGLEKMKLNGEHNDVSILRSKASYDLLTQCGLPSARTSYIKLYINNEYKGLYIHVEHFDEEYIQKRFPNDDSGNLFKCFYGSDLTFHGTNPTYYQNTYELKTNEAFNDYSGLIQFINVLNNSAASNFACDIQEVFDVDSYLRTLAVEILIGQWDGYAYNKNNYFLYERPSDGKFIFMEYDLDNTFGIDWYNIDWSTRNIYSWANANRPLYSKLMAVPYFKDRFNYHMKDILTNYFLPATMTSTLQSTQNLISCAALADDYKGYDYGFTDQDFLNAINQAWGFHVTQSISEYIQNRYTSANNQVLPFQNSQNPCTSGLIEWSETENSKAIKAFDMLGREIQLDAKNCLKVITYENGTTRQMYEME
ncbi:MAG: CotH kinase family protein [Flavobacteriia bacterium]